MPKTGTSISCMDGRVQEPIREWMGAQFGIDYVDTITLPGMDKVVAENASIGQVREMAALSVRAHSSPVIVVSGHHDCAGNPVSEEKHAEHIRKSVDVIRSWELGVDVFGVWVNSEWRVEKVA